MNRPARYLPLVVLTAVLAAIPLFGLPAYFVSFLFKVYLFVILAVSWTLIGGFAGYVNLGHVAFFGVGAYTAAMLLKLFALSPFIGAFPGGIVAAAVAWLVGYPCLKVRGPYFVVVTMCLASVIDLAIRNWDWVGGARGIHLALPPFEIGLSRAIFYEVFLVSGLCDGPRRPVGGALEVRARPRVDP